jgi:threonine dehydrogenase-like Zn-dependent dehydrogenase
MRAIQVVAPGDVQFLDVPEPELRPGFALVRPLLVALCGSDVRTVYRAPREEYPFDIGRGGHEIVGVVQAINGEGAEVDVGNVALTLVEEEIGMAEMVATPISNLLPLPGRRPLEHFVLAQQLGTVIYACKRLPNLVDKDVAVIGQGSVGLFFNAMLRRMGARRVLGLDVIRDRARAAKQFGATHGIHTGNRDPVKAVRDVTDGQMVDLVVEAAGEPETINLMAKMVKVGGTILSFGVLRGPHTMEFDYWTLFRRRCRLISSDRTGEEPGLKSFRLALEYIGGGRIDVGPMITHRFPFDRVVDAYELARTREDGAIKILVEMPSYPSFLQKL